MSTFFSFKRLLSSLFIAPNYFGYGKQKNKPCVSQKADTQGLFSDHMFDHFEKWTTWKQ